MENQILLTQKEKNIITWKSEGRTVGEIAALLTVSKRYAEMLIGGLYRKIGVTKDTALISWAYQNGILKINAENRTGFFDKAG